MISSPPNLFNALFEFRPRDGQTPEENFLSESFAHILKTVEGATERWVSRILQRKIQLAPDFEILTRNSEVNLNENSTVFPDLEIKATTILRERLYIYAEHKWGANCDVRQLQTYAEIAKRNSGILIFVGETSKQINYARQVLPNHYCFFWEDVYVEMDKISPRTDLLNQFLHFMKTKGLSPAEPLTTEQIKAFRIARNFQEQLERYANKLNNDYEWKFLPKRYCPEPKPNVTSKWGRAAIEFASPNWSPTITVGFLYSVDNHQVEFTQNDGIDLILRIEANPSKNPNPQDALKILQLKANALRKLNVSVLTKGDRGNGNKNTLLIAQKNLANVIEGKTIEREQLEAIYAQLKSWCEILFIDGELEKALLTIKS